MNGYSQFSVRAEALGLRRWWVLSRRDVEARLPAPDLLENHPAIVLPDYRRLILLGSPGRAFWESFRQSLPRLPDPAENPLDLHTGQVVEQLCAGLRGIDPGMVALYPFRHPRRLLGFQRLLGDSPWTSIAPFGVQIDPEYGPWLAWRAAILTTLNWPLSSFPERSPCSGCIEGSLPPTPCEAACPAGAVHRHGFDWRACTAYRRAHPTCRETCLARMACPVGTPHRYGAEQMRHHYTASLREIEKMGEGGDATQE